MTKKILKIFILFSFFVACKKQNSQHDIREFRLPKIVNSELKNSESIRFKAGGISDVFPRFIGKYRFSDSIDINPTARTDFRKSDYVKHYGVIKSTDSLDVNGFDFITDYKTTVKFCKHPEIDSTIHEYYPVYFVNATSNSKLFPLKDSYIYGIQEAKSLESGYNWRPIESRGFDFCGNGHWGIKVHPNEFVLALIRKYKGDFETDIRVRVKVGESIYVSKPFIGEIDRNQFLINDNDYIKMQLRKSNGESSSWLFNGSMPNPSQWAIE